jgi:MFS family permease
MFVHACAQVCISHNPFRQELQQVHMRLVPAPHVRAACRGYLLTQVIGGIAADRLGGKVVLGLGVVWWSVATVLTPLAAKVSLPVLLGMRALMGIGEGVAMPAMNNMLSRWVPASERSRSLALVYSGMYVGSMLGLGVSPGLIASHGWPSVFYIFGSLGVLWWAVWSFAASSTPSEAQDISKEEADYIRNNTSVSRVRALARNLPTVCCAASLASGGCVLKCVAVGSGLCNGIAHCCRLAKRCRKEA